MPTLHGKPLVMAHGSGDISLAAAAACQPSQDECEAVVVGFWGLFFGAGREMGGCEALLHCRRES